MKVSVLMCVKNGERYLSEAVQSILAQTYDQFELIIVLNCCEDNSPEIIKQYSDPRIRTFETDICQLSYNLNFGLGQARGEYIARIDADDLAVPHRLERQLHFLEHGFDVVGSNMESIDEAGNLLGKMTYPESDRKIRSSIFYRSVLAHPAVMFRKETVMKAGGYLGGRYAQDHDLWLRLMRDENIRFYNIQDSLVKYRIHNNQSKGNKSSYAHVAGYLLRESISSRKASYFLGSIIYSAKGLLR